MYFPPDTATCNTDKVDYFSVLQCDIGKYKNDYKIVIMWDFNAWTNTLIDIVNHYSGLKCPL